MIRQLLYQKGGVVGLFIVTLLAATAVLAPILAGDPTDTDFGARLEPPLTEHWFGTDRLGREILDRIIWGARISIANGLGALLIGCGIGVSAGALVGYIGQNTDRIVMRVVDVLLAFPTLLLAIATVAVLGTGSVQTVMAIGIALIAPFARLTRGEVLRVKNWEFIHASRTSGASDWWIVTRHILPNIMTPITVYATLQFGTVILTEASLSFLGLGPSPPSPSWGLMVNEGLSFINTAWWISIVPGVAIYFTVLGVNLLGDALRDTLDPRVTRQ